MGWRRQLYLKNKMAAYQNNMAAKQSKMADLESNMEAWNREIALKPPQPSHLSLTKTRYIISFILLFIFIYIFNRLFKLLELQS